MNFTSGGKGRYDMVIEELHELLSLEWEHAAARVCAMVFVFAVVVFTPALALLGVAKVMRACRAVWRAIFPEPGPVAKKFLDLLDRAKRVVVERGGKKYSVLEADGVRFDLNASWMGTIEIGEGPDRVENAMELMNSHDRTRVWWKMCNIMQVYNDADRREELDRQEAALAKWTNKE